MRRPRDGTGRVSRAIGGMRQVKRSSLSRAVTRAAKPPRVSNPMPTRVATSAPPRAISRMVMLTPGKTVVITRISDSMTRTARISVARTLSQSRLTQGPSTALSLQSRSRKTLALGQQHAGERLHRGGDQAERRPGNEHDPGGGTTTIAAKVA